MKIKTEIIGNIYLIKVIDFDNECEYHFNIHKDGKFIMTLFNQEGKAEYKLMEDGLYYCRIAVFKNGKKEETMTSKVREFFSDKSKKQLKDIISGITTTKMILPFAPSQFPFCDICVVMRKFGGGYIKHSVDTNGKTFNLGDGSKIYFSGIIKYKDNLLTDISDMYTEIEFKDKLGSYFAIIETTNGFDVFNDYFGEQKIFYYENSEWLVCSNRYHFMLNKMIDLKIRLELDVDNCVMGFASTYANFSENPINEKMNVKGVKFCPLEERLIIENNGIQHIKRKIYEDLYTYLDISTAYEKMLQDVKEEVISNIKCCMENPLIKNIVADLSGGLDSRLVFSAITNLADGKKIKIRTEAFPSVQDFHVATTIADDFAFKYDYELTQKFEGKKVMPYSLEEILDIDDSIQLGTYFGFTDVLNSKNTSRDYLEICGSLGEAVTRFYMTGEVGILDKWGNTENDKKVLEDFIEIISRFSVADYDKVGKKFEENLLNEMKKIQFKSSVHKLETLYLKYRNRFHGDIGLNCGYRVLQWQPLQSPKSLQLFHSSISKFKCDKYVFDLLYSINPYLVKYPFSSKYYNDEIAKFQSMLIFNGGSAFFQINENSNSYNKGLEKFSNSFADNYNETNLNLVNSKNIKNINLYLLNRMLPSFSLVMQYKGGIFFDKFGNSIWHICKNILLDNNEKFQITKFRVIYRKIISLANEIQLIEMSNDNSSK